MSAFEIIGETILLGEGKEEAALFRQMALERLIPSYAIAAPDEFSGPGGVTGIGQFLIALSGLPRFEEIRKLLIVADKDLDSNAALLAIQDQIRSANRSPDIADRFSVPEQPYVAANDAEIEVSVFLTPLDRDTGCLESYLWRAFQEIHRDEAECIESLLDCLGLEWPEQKILKAKVRIGIASTYRRNPAITLAHLWKNAPGHLPASSRHFLDFSHFLSR